MKTLRIKTNIQKDGHLKIDIPTSLKEGDVEVLLVIETPDSLKNKYSFSDLAGKLKWNGDALAVQKELRNEW
ncbi:MAG: hypothetical protein JW864_14615 [Spirochaetes bacterium]|nr:hypothetical protein [Spirochaetota bacterium]